VSQPSAAEVVGVDGCPGGWVAIVLSRGVVDDAVFAPRFDEMLSTVPAAAVVAVDIPIGLPERGWREADAAARKFLRGQASSVFSTPPRPVVEAETYPEANRRCRELTGKGLSSQAFNLTQKILDVDRSRVRAGSRLYEVHPEVSFRALADGPLEAAKRTWAGHIQRRALLERAGILVPADLGPVGRRAGADDVLDAAVAAWSAQRIAAGTARSLPDPPSRDREGRAVAIWY
jgi:predicted RNase H-like nuclease